MTALIDRFTYVFAKIDRNLRVLRCYWWRTMSTRSGQANELVRKRLASVEKLESAHRRGA